MSENQNPQIYQKTVTITSLSSKDITPKPGQTFQAFTVFFIGGNDGITYETVNRDYYAQRKVGEVIKINYKVESTVGSNKQVYSHYKLVMPKSVNANAEQLGRILNGVTMIYQMLQDTKKDLLARIDVLEDSIAKGANVIRKTENQEPALPEVQIGEELQSLYNENYTPEGDVEDDPKVVDLPF